MATVRTRFAPSPTGYMHIGGMRTALFNWLWARHNEGQFILRIDDTDQERNVEQALIPILRAFRWLGLDWDEGPEVGGVYAPYFQSQRHLFYDQSKQQLLDAGQAYHDYDTPEQIRADRQAAKKEGRNYLNIRRSLELTAEQIEQYELEGRPSVVRFSVPRDQFVTIDDAIRGRVEWDCSLICDPVIVRGNGSPLYNFATAVDDGLMQITHVIRGEEHLSNTPIQALIHQALGHELPQFVHIPYVAAPGSKEKLSKRKLDKYRKNPQFKKMFDKADQVLPQIGLAGSRALDPVMVEYYVRMGYLPAAVLNALARLGWSLDDKTEIMTLESIIDNFTLDRVIKSPAGFDPDKLISLQTHWIGQLPIEDKIDGCLAYLVKAGLIDAHPDTAVRSYISEILVAMGNRLKIFCDILDHREFFVADDQLDYDEKAFEKRIRKTNAADLLEKFSERLATTETFDAESLEKLMHDFVETEGIKIGQIIHSVRVAVSGKSVGIGLFDCLALLGRKRCLIRLDRALKRL